MAMASSRLQEKPSIEAVVQHPISRPALRATAPMPKESELFRAWPASRTTTCEGNSLSGARATMRPQRFRCLALRANYLMMKSRRLRRI